MKLSFHPAFLQDLMEASRWYEGQEPGLGRLFIEEVDQGISMIEDHPAAWRVLMKDVRRFVLRRFPYAIHYRLLPEGQGIRFLTLKHGARHPRVGLRRR